MEDKNMNSAMEDFDPKVDPIGTIRGFLTLAEEDKCPPIEYFVFSTTFAFRLAEVLCTYTLTYPSGEALPEKSPEEMLDYMRKSTPRAIFGIPFEIQEDFDHDIVAKVKVN